MGMVIPVGGVTAYLADIDPPGGPASRPARCFSAGWVTNRSTSWPFSGSGASSAIRTASSSAVSPLATLFDWADDHGARVLAQLHSHGLSARMSVTDQALRTDGRGLHQHDRSRGRRARRRTLADGMVDVRWRTVGASGPARVAEGSCLTVVFDESEAVRDG